MAPLAAQRRLVPALNLAVLGVSYVALWTRSRPFPPTYYGVLIGGGLFLVLAALLSSSRPAGWRWIRAVTADPRAAFPAAILPWIGLLILLATRGLWWTQRPPALKFFVAYALANWSIAWLWLAGSGNRSAVAPPSATADRPIRALLSTLSVLLALLAFDGMALGVSPFGVAVSALLACIAGCLLAAALLGGHTLRANALAACLGLALGLAVVESGVRLLHLGDSLLEIDSAEYARRFHHITPPGTAFVNRPKPLDEFAPAMVEINSLGIRGAEIPPGPVDLLLLGDSMIEARQLPWQDTLAPRLQRTLNARSATVRVVGHGVRGWSPLLEWNWYLKVGRSLHARTVMLFFFWNDLWPRGDEVHTFGAVMARDGRPDHFEVVVDSDLVWYKHVRAVRLTEDALHRVGLQAIRRMFSMIGTRSAGGGADLASAKALARGMAGGPPLTRAEIDTLLTQPAGRLDARLRDISENMFWPGIRPLSLWTDDQRGAAAKTERELARFAEDVAADGGRLVIVYVPNAYQIASRECSVSRALDGLDDEVLLPERSGIQDWLTEVGRRQAIDVLDPSDAMRAFERGPGSSGGPLYLRADCHWSARGHQFMADYLADWYVGRSRQGR